MNIAVDKKENIKNKIDFEDSENDSDLSYGEIDEKIENIELGEDIMNDKDNICENNYDELISYMDNLAIQENKDNINIKNMSSNLNITKNEENELDELTNRIFDKYYSLPLKDRINLKNKDKNNEIPKNVIINNLKPRKRKKDSFNDSLDKKSENTSKSKQKKKPKYI